MDYAAWHSVVTDDNGKVVPMATITVRHTDTGALARLYNARDGSEPKSNPFQTGADGMISFFAAGGAYTVIATSGTMERRWSFVPIGTAQEYDIDSLAEYLNSGVIYHQTYDDMAASQPLQFPAASVVLADPDGSKNGYYTNDGSGWLFARTMPDSIARATIYNNTDVNSPKANISQGINPSSPIVFFLDVASPNTGSVTLTIDGIGTGTVLNAAGNALSTGEWLGRVMLTREQDGRFRIVNDPASAIAAALSATQAGEARDDAVTAKDLAEIFADDASNSADNAAVSEGNAASSASNAASSATAAGNSATAAAGSASDASTKASEAEASATAAAGSASTASTKASEAEASATAAAGSATSATNQANRAETEADRAEAAAGGLINAVQFVPQTLTPAQQEQARQNIGAISIEDVHTQVGKYISESLRIRRKVVNTQGAGYKIREIGNIFELKDGGYGFVFSEHLDPYSENNVYVYLATSTDGVTWTRSNTPIVARSSEDPYVVIIDGNYHLYVEDKEEVPFRSIRLYTSPDLSSWTDAGNILNPTPVGDWESEDVSSPVVFFYDGKWNLYYEGRGTWPTAPYNSGAIGLATSSDGINWTRNPNNPVLRGYQDGVSNTWFSHVAPDDVLVLDDTVVLYAHPFVPRDRLTDSSTGGFFCSAWITNDLVNIYDALGKPTAIQVTPGNSERSVDTLMLNKFSDQVSFFASNYADGVYEYVDDKSKCLLSAYASASTITSFTWQRLPITSLKYIVGIGTVNNGGLNILAKTAGVYKLDVAAQFPLKNTSISAATSRVQILRGDGSLSRSINLTQGDIKGFSRRGATEIIVLCPGDQLYFEIFSENIIEAGLEINMSINLERL